jgi:hypothetical protein
MIAAVAGCLVGWVVAFFVGRHLSERLPNWIGCFAWFVVACVAGSAAVLILAFGGGWLIDQVYTADPRFAVEWLRSVLGWSLWVPIVGAAFGVVSGRRRASSRRDALAELARMKAGGPTDKSLF